MTNYGFSANFSYTQDDKGVSVGAHVKDSAGLDVSAEHQGKNITESVNALFSELYDKVIDVKKKIEKEKTPDQRIKDLEEKNSRLEHRIQSLMKQLEEPNKKTPQAYKISSKKAASHSRKPSEPDTIANLNKEINRLLKLFNY